MHRENKIDIKRARKSKLFKRGQSINNREVPSLQEKKKHNSVKL